MYLILKNKKTYVVSIVLVFAFEKRSVPSTGKNALLFERLGLERRSKAIQKRFSAAFDLQKTNETVRAK